MSEQEKSEQLLQAMNGIKRATEGMKCLRSKLLGLGAVLYPIASNLKEEDFLNTRRIIFESFPKGLPSLSDLPSTLAEYFALLDEIALHESRVKDLGF